MSPNLRLYDLDVAHQVRLSRRASSISSDLLGLVDDAVGAVGRDVRLADLTGGTVPTNRRQLELLVESVRTTLVDDLVGDVRARLQAHVVELAAYEAAFQTRALQTVSRRSSLSHVSESSLTRAVLSAHAAGRTLDEWVEDAASATFRRARDALRRHHADGKPSEVLQEAVVGTRALRYKDGASAKLRSDVEGLVRTLVTSCTVVAKTAVFDLNDDVVDRVQWRSSLDLTTSPPCRANDGQVWPLSEGPRPPAHWRCRSTVVGLLRGQDPAARESYDAWLRRQPVDVQDEVLGEVRARLWREARVPLTRFVDDTGRQHTVAQLRELERRAFARMDL